MEGIRLKVCGMRETDNIRDLAALSPDFMGLIFYQKSKRYVGHDFKLTDLPPGVKKVGVIVNEDRENVLELVERYDLDYVQLHGNESVEDCRYYRDKGTGVIKVFSVMDVLPVKELEKYQGDVDYFLFDTKTPDYGGSGQKFDWEVLSEYNGKVPFFLSGGIGVDDIETIINLGHPMLFAIDINSRVEISPGLKDIVEIEEIMRALQGHPSESPLKGRVSYFGDSPLEGGKGGVKPRNKIIPYKPYLKDKARQLRKDSTTSEVLLWMEVKNRQISGYQFHRQVPMLDYIVDFYCHELNLVIEVDGDSHDQNTLGDSVRQGRLEEEGVRFLRFDDIDVKKNMIWVLQEIRNWIEKNG